MKRRTIYGVSLAALTLAAIACNSNTASTSEPTESGDNALAGVESLPEGVATHGEALFQGTDADQQLGCHACHSLDGTNGVGPSLQGVSGRIPEGYDSAEAYLYESIVQPDAHLVEGYENIMPSNFENRLDAQSMADLIAFLSQQ